MTDDNPLPKPPVPTSDRPTGSGARERFARTADTPPSALATRRGASGMKLVPVTGGIASGKAGHEPAATLGGRRGGRRSEREPAPA